MFLVRKILFAGVELTFQRVRGGTSELPGRPASNKTTWYMIVLPYVVDNFPVYLRGFREFESFLQDSFFDSGFCSEKRQYLESWKGQILSKL